MNMISPHKAPKIPLTTFTSVDFKAIDLIQDDPSVIKFEIINCIVRKMFADRGSWTDILF